MAARLVSDSSAKLFIGLYVKDTKPVEEAVVLSVNDQSFDVLILRYGQSCRVYSNQLDVSSSEFKMERGVPSLKLTWNTYGLAKSVDVSTIKICSLVKVEIVINETDLQKWTVSICNAFNL